MNGFESKSTDTILVIRENLLSGLDKVADHQDNGTLDTQKSDGAATPRQFGAFVLMLLTTVNEELASRGIDQKW